MSRKAFTLVELVVVAGVVTLLIAILMPAIGRSRESARQVQCASNLRQIAVALIGYTQDNRGRFPGIATAPQRPWDWVFWMRTQSPLYADFRDAPLMRYLGKADESILRCPSDDLTTHRPGGGRYREPFPYSYQMNGFTAGERINCCSLPPGGKTPSSQIKHASQKILLIEGNEAMVIDGVWVPPLPTSPRFHDLADRHEQLQRRPAGGWLTSRGNVAFVDSHVEFVSQTFAHDPAHYDPAW